MSFPWSKFIPLFLLYFYNTPPSLKEIFVESALQHPSLLIQQKFGRRIERSPTPAMRHANIVERLV
jgi:hypothetical protein